MSDHVQGEVIGFRQWYVTPDLELRAAHKRAQLWTPGENRAVCEPDAKYDLHNPRKPYQQPTVPKPCEHVPATDCHCGLYALHAPEDFWYGRKGAGLTWNSLVYGTSETDTLVSGVIVAWGNIEVHYQGFRAQYARITGLALPESKRDQVIVRTVAEAYGVPCVPAEELSLLAEACGQTVPEELRPEKPAPKPDHVSITFSSGAFSSSGLLSQMVYGNTYQKRRKGSAYTSGNLWSECLGLDPYVSRSKSELLKPKPGDIIKYASGGSVKRPKYDPRAYLPKRKGGLA